MYRVHLGYTVTGRNRWRRFETLDEAIRFVAAVFETRGVVLAIEAEVTA